MDARLRDGIRLFNDRKFFECHEVLEGYYQDSELDAKPFLEGMIQLAAAFRMFVDFAEVKGPVRAIYQALIRFENYHPMYLQVRVRDFSTEVEAWAKAAEAAGASPSAATIPKIKFQHFSLFS
jgi:predicted metal-dependent hydrolase